MKQPPEPNKVEQILEEHNLFVLKMPYFNDFIQRLMQESTSMDVYNLIDDVMRDLEELHDQFTPDFDSDFYG